ncbi:MAG: hypothetical protein N3E45_05135 [Oscillatoriaceae bacterium SKW80]|nr:hypothetical protein [Oscillatoriaceae bacterium SKYG93]MCX8120198.1 hypothetical protein [Oscillatoriaceae bacterium SKW80]MDW8453124.1 PIN domain-containing protein [Oscillatoriaceae cyanobacterium SKYGB_i_bin93]HIK28964.1 hypothetical protein [Oscillatoriaceae cyanobacterium M7585_C2015_266]
MKSATFPPILVVVDLSAIINCAVHEWKMFSRLGRCCVPQALYDEIDSLSQNSSKPNLAKVAREFLRFWKDSGWLIISTKSSHPLLEAAAEAVSNRQAQLMLEIAKCTYGLAQEHNDKLIVFTSHRQPLLNWIKSIGAANICILSEKVLLKWAKTGKPPVEAIKQWEVINGVVDTPDESCSLPISERPISKFPHTGKPISSKPSPTSGNLGSRVGKVASAVREGKDKSEESVYIPKMAPTLITVKSSKPGFFASLFYLVVTLIALTFAFAIMWRAINPKSFNHFWQQKIEPELPQQLRGIFK